MHVLAVLTESNFLKYVCAIVLSQEAHKYCFFSLRHVYKSYPKSCLWNQLWIYILTYIKRNVTKKTKLWKARLTQM